MVSIKGKYENGKIILEDQVAENPEREIPVIVTFLENVEINEEVPKKINLNHFSFNRSRELLKNFKGSLSDTIIEERRSFV